jgi:hypothetical protein
MVTTVPALLTACADSRPTQECFIDFSSGPFGSSQPLTWTYGESLQGSLAAAAAFQIYEFTGPIGILSRPTHQSIIAELGVLIAGGVLIPMTQEMIPLEYQTEQNLGLDELLSASNQTSESGVKAILGETARYRLVRSIRQTKVRGIICSEEFLGILTSVREFLDPGFRILLIRDRGFFELPQQMKEDQVVESRSLSAESSTTNDSSFQGSPSSMGTNQSVTFGGNKQTQSMKSSHSFSMGSNSKNSVFEFYKLFLDGMEAIKIQEIRNQLVEMAQKLDPEQPAMLIQLPNELNRMAFSHGQLFQKSLLLGKTLQITESKGRVLLVHPGDEFLTRLGLYGSWIVRGTFALGPGASSVFRDFLPQVVLLNSLAVVKMREGIDQQIAYSPWKLFYKTSARKFSNISQLLVGALLVPKIQGEFGTKETRYFLLHNQPDSKEAGLLETYKSIIQWFRWMKLPLKILGVNGFYQIDETTYPSQ